MKVKLSSGNHDLIGAPVFFKTKEIDLDCFRLIDPDQKKYLAQCCSVGDNSEREFVFVIDYLKKGETVIFDTCMQNCECCESEKSMKSVIDDGTVNIYIDGEYFTSYYFKTDIPKPYLGPFSCEDGEHITRHNYTGKEHPHHRSLWFSHGDVNGTDTWNEPENHGFIITNKISSVTNGAVMTSFTAENTWTHHDKTPVLNDVTEITAYNTGSFLKVIDIALTLKSDYCDVTLGETKEAGPVAIRFADSLIVDNGGTIQNYYGAINEGEIWMKRAGFNDYYGKCKNGGIYGIAMFDSPENEGYPTYWHTRNYGLMAVNNFYIGGKRLIKKGESMNYKFRVIIHKDDTATAKISEIFNNYITKPDVQLINN